MVSNDLLDKWPSCGGNFDDPLEHKTQNISFYFRSRNCCTPPDCDGHFKEPPPQAWFGVKNLKGADKGSGAQGGQGGRKPVQATQYNRKPLTQAQIDMIKGGSMITRARKDQL